MDLFSCYTIRIRPNTDNPLLGTALSCIVKQRLASEAQAAVILTTRYSLITYSRTETGIRGTGSSYTHVVGEAQDVAEYTSTQCTSSANSCVHADHTSVPTCSEVASQSVLLLQMTPVQCLLLTETKTFTNHFINIGLDS